MNDYYKGRDNDPTGRFNYTDEQVEKWRDRCMNTPREICIQSLIQKEKENASIDDLPFPPTEADKGYFERTKKFFLDRKKEYGEYPTFKCIGE